MHALEVIMIIQTTLEAESCHVLELIDFLFHLYSLLFKFQDIQTLAFVVVAFFVEACTLTD